MNDRQAIRGFKPGVCQKCGGDAFLDGSDGPEWRCLQCGRSLRQYSPVQPETRRYRARAVLPAASGDEEPVAAGRIEGRTI